MPSRHIFYFSDATVHSRQDFQVYDGRGNARVAQMVECRFENPEVGVSKAPLGTILIVTGRGPEEEGSPPWTWPSLNGISTWGLA